MRTHIPIKTWLIERDNHVIGSIRAVGFEVGHVFEANVANQQETLRVVNVNKEAFSVQVK